MAGYLSDPAGEPFGRGFHNRTYSSVPVNDKLVSGKELEAVDDFAILRIASPELPRRLGGHRLITGVVRVQPVAAMEILPHAVWVVGIGHDPVKVGDGVRMKLFPDELVGPLAQ